MSIEETPLFSRNGTRVVANSESFFCRALLSSPCVSRAYDGVDVSETVTDKYMHPVLMGSSIEFCSFFNNYTKDALASYFLHIFFLHFNPLYWLLGVSVTK